MIPSNGELVARRGNFVGYLYGLHTALGHGDHRASKARAELARLRRSLGGQQQADAYQIVFRHNPPESEEKIWLLVAGLFALHPQGPPRAIAGWSLGSSMLQLGKKREGSTIERHMTQLLAADQDALPYHLRHAIRLLKTEDVAIDYDRLLDDLRWLLSSNFTDQAAHGVRLQWARDFYRPEPAKDKKSSGSSNQGDNSDH